MLKQGLHALVCNGAVAQRHELERCSACVFEDVDKVVVDIQRTVLIELQESGNEKSGSMKVVKRFCKRCVVQVDNSWQFNISSTPKNYYRLAQPCNQRRYLFPLADLLSLIVLICDYKTRHQHQSEISFVPGVI